MPDPSSVRKSSESREILEGFVDFVESQPDNIEPEDQELDDFLAYNQLLGMHETGRNKNHLANLLNMNVSDLERLFDGKSVLDVGCGEGKLTRDISLLKKTKVTALDHDPEVLDKVIRRKNVDIVEGSGFDLEAAVGDEEFDVVVSSYSSFYWANNAEDIKTSLDSAISVCSLGGLVVLVPVVDDPSYRSLARDFLSRTAPPVEERDVARLARLSNIRDWLDVARIRTVFEKEEKGEIDPLYVPGRSNGDKGKVNLVTGVPPETYSAIIEVVEKP